MATMTGNVTIKVWKDELEVHGDTYENKAFIKELGGKFEKDFEAYWVLPADKKQVLLDAGATLESESDRRRTIKKGDRFFYNGKERMVVSVNWSAKWGKIYYGTFKDDGKTLEAGVVYTMSLNKAFKILL